MKKRASYAVRDIIEQEDSGSAINSYIKILAPIQLTLEIRGHAEREDYMNIFMTSPKGSELRLLRGEEEIQKFNARTPHMHDFYELLIVLDGEIRQQIEQSDLVFRSGSCCLMNHNIVHKEIFSSDATVLFIGMSRNLARHLAEDAQGVFFPEAEQPDANPMLRFLMENSGSAYTKEYLDFLPAIRNEGSHRVLRSLADGILRAILFPRLGSTHVIKGMLLELFDRLSDPAQFHLTPVCVEADSDFLIFSHVSHLMEDTDGRITRTELERALNYSGNYINTIVRKYTGLCLFDYGQTFCMKRAASLLLDTDAPVSEIMRELRFTNASHFYKCFKAQYRMTPGQFRRTRRGLPPQGDGERATRHAQKPDRRPPA